MKALAFRIRDFLRNEDGPTATEYAVMLALIIVVCIAGVTLMGSTVSGVFDNVNTQLSGS